MLALFMVVIILFVGMAIDFGFAYVTKASLSKSVDAACLTGARNLSQGRSQADTLARSSFALNYGTSGRDVSAPAVSVEFPIDASGYTQVKVTATARIRTFFIRILPQFSTLTISADAQAFRANLVMSVVLDRSGSLQDNHGWRYLPRAVEDFIENFDDDNDQVSMVSFASDDTTDVQRKKNFKANIHSQFRGWGRNKFEGGTYAVGGLARARVENDNYIPASGENVLKVAVFFTDGRANTNEDVLSCSPRPVRYGGCSPAETGCGMAYWHANNPRHYLTCDSYVFPAQQPGNPGRLRPEWAAMADITADAEYRLQQIATEMRQSSPYPTTFYAIGLGDDNTINKAFLRQLVNDPNSPTFDSRQPEGEALFTSDPSELDELFDRIASKILLRLTQ
jgi:Flp pilus assembly protein TadG